MKKLKNTMKRIATLGLTAVLLTNSFPAAAFAAGIDGAEPAIVMDEELSDSIEEVSAGESGEDALDEVLSEDNEEISGKEMAGEKAEGNPDDQLSGKELSDEENDTTGDAVTPTTAPVSDETDEDAVKDSKEDKEEYPAFEKSKSIDGIKISVTADEGVFPDGAMLSVEKVTKAQEEQAQEAVESERDKDQNVAASYTFDIKVLDKDGNEIEPVDQSKVKVSFTLDEVADSNLETNIYHITENTDDIAVEDSGNSEDAAAQGENAAELTVEKLEVETDGDTATAETDGFSLYTVEFTYHDLQYVLPGDSSIELSEILDKVGLTGEASAVEVSDESLFSAEKKDDEWVVTAHKAFSTTEWMKVTINSVVYEITVTDTTTSTINVGGTDYTLFTGFTATDGTAVDNAFVYGNAVDGSTSTSWHPQSSDTFVEFNTDDPIIPKGYIFNTYMEGYFYPQAWVLKAKANATDGWTTLSSYSGQTLSSGQEFQYACSNDGNTLYKYFRFEASNTNDNIWLTEIRLYGSSPDVYYTHLTKKDATCTETGIKQDCYLRSDGKYFTDETGTTELTESDVIDPIKPHTGEHHEATDVNIEYWQCSMCSKYFSNEGCTTEITEEETKIYRTITIDGSIGELVTSNVNQALAGATVTLTVSHLIDASTLKVNNGAVELTDIGSNHYTFTVPADNVTVTAETLSTYSFSLPDNIEMVSATNEADGNGKYISGTVITFAPSLRYSASNVSDGTNTLEPNANGVYTVTIDNANINITATVVGSSTLYLAGATSDFTAADGETLVGSTSHTVTIANGANITLNNATITGGIVCEGTATITLDGTNSVSVVQYNKAGIQIGSNGTTLTIRGDGSLTATGGSAAAGIGLGRTWDENVTAGTIVIEGGTVNANGDIGIGIGTVGNRQTATIDGISIKGGTVNASLGKGNIYYGSTATVGYIKIYDTIDMVDASKITETVTYMHVDGESATDVTANKTDYFTIGENGNRRIIVPKDDNDYTITIADGIEHGTITGATTAKYMETVTINATPDFGYRLVRLVVKDADNNDVASTGNTFQMPKGGATVSAVFEQGVHGTTEFVWGYSGPGGFVNEATIYDGVTTVNIQQTGQSYNILKYEGYNYSKFRLDNDTYEANIPYAGGTGEFYGAGNATNFSLNYDGETGYYDITMTDAGNGKWSVSILPTAAQMDVVPDQTYTGSAITPEPLVIAGSLSLTKGEDYTYSYENNINVGTATVRATFQGDYASLGYVEKTFVILPHIHNFTYSANGATITATCTAANCPMNDHNATLTIVKPTLTTYGGTGNAEATLTDENNIKGSATISYQKKTGDNTWGDATETAPTSAGTYKASITLGEGNGSATTSVEYTIEPKTVTITGVTATTRDYAPDKLTVTLTGGEVSGKIGSDDVTADLSAATGTMTDTNAGTDKAVTVTGVKLGGTDAGNYTLSSQPTGVKVTINKVDYSGTKTASATVRSEQVTTNATIILPALPERAESYGEISTSGELISGTPSVSGRTLTFSTTSQDNDTTGTITIVVPESTNYNSYSFVVTVTAKDKDEAGVTVNGGTDKTVTYGAADFTLSKIVTNAGTGTGVWTWESSEPSVAAIGVHTGTITIKKAGTTTIKAIYESETTIGEASISLTVDPKTLGITWSNTSIPYDGSSHVPTVAKTGVETGDDCTVDVSGAKTNVGSGYTATASLSGTDAGNYTLPENKKTCSFSITRAALTVTAKPKTITYGSAPANDGVTYSGFVNNETTSVLKGTLAYDYNYSQYGNVGSYSITPKGLTADNYAISFVSGTLTVVQKEVGLTWSNTPLTFNGSAQAPTATATGLVNNDTVSVTVTGAQTNAGTGYTATASGLTGAKAGNYKLPAANTTTFSIDRASHEDGAASGELKYGLSGSVALSSLIEPGGSLGAVTVTDTNSVFDGTPALSGSDLGFSFVNDPDKVGKTATVEIPVTGCTNYLDYKIVVTVTVISCAHEHTEIRDAKVATCVAQGYTGDTYCTECGSKLESGSPIPIDPDNHSYDGGVITKQPTILSEGVKTYTCTRCHHTYTETVPKVDDGEDHSDLIEDITDEEGKTKAEVKIEDKEDGSKETTVTVGGQEVEKTVTDAEGNETVETRIWIGGLKSSYTYTGSAIKPSFHVYDGTKKLSSGTDYSVSYKNNTKVGTSATITITFKGNYKGTAQEKVTFTITPAVLGEDVKALDLAVAGTGKLQKPAPTVVWTSTGKTVSGKNFNFAYKDAAGNDMSGVKGEGTYIVTVSPKNGSFTGSMTATITVTSKNLLISKASVTLKPNKYTYTGDPIIPPSGSYTLKVSGVTLAENTDYVVADVTNNINAGTATIIFAAKEGNAAGYAGTKSATFKIVKGRELKEGDGFTYSYSSSVPYAKGGAKPSVTVKDGEDTLVLNKDYTVSYSKNTAVTNGATAVMTVKGKGNYKGSVKLYYAVTTQDIAKLKDGITVADKPESKKGYKNPSVTIIDLGGKKLKAGTDFKIGTDYSEPDADGKVTVTVFGNGKYNGSIQVSYRYIKAAQQLSKVKSMKSISAQTYTGKAIRLKTADLTGILYVGNKKSPTYLVPGTDFVVLSYSNNTKAGTAKVTLKGMGNYGGTRTLTFKIKQKKGDYKGSLVDGEWKN